MITNDLCRGHRERLKDIGQGSTVEMSRLMLFFKGRAVQKINVERVYGISDNAPSVAYVSLETIRLLRDNFINRRDATREGRQNKPVLDKRELKRRLIEPKNRWEDTYILVILIALAQERRRRRGYDEDCMRVHAAVLENTCSRQMYFYTAVFPVEFLDRFENPNWESIWNMVEVRYTYLDLGDDADSSIDQFNETMIKHNVRVML